MNRSMCAPGTTTRRRGVAYVVRVTGVVTLEIAAPRVGIQDVPAMARAGSPTGRCNL
jgi:hypothetical protein